LAGQLANRYIFASLPFAGWNFAAWKFAAWNFAAWNFAAWNFILRAGMSFCGLELFGPGNFADWNCCGFFEGLRVRSSNKFD
jgi:hypothetical protein